ncbi:MAG TPA: TRAP transporter TatT component family protein [Thermoanaerobaculia bacterium]|nr:TRAP transporter TatT component family protein [Thermoanaerobaculia bacterium]
MKRAASWVWPRLSHCLVLGAAVLALASCSVKRVAVHAAANALAGGTDVYAADDDPELVRAALPFGLKTIEALLAQDPRNAKLLLAAASGFTQYSYAFVQQEADFVEERDLARATELRARARRLYLRALGYGWRGLEVDFPGLRARLQAEPEKAEAILTGMAGLKKEHVPLLYWTASAWAAAIALAKDDAELSADLAVVEGMMRRALALDEGFGQGALHDFFLVYEGSRTSVGGSLARAREHLARTTALSQGQRAAPLVSFAETVDVGTQNRVEFERLLNQALAIDPDKVPGQRLANLIAQRRARWLLGRTDALFIE